MKQDKTWSGISMEQHDTYNIGKHINAHGRIKHVTASSMEQHLEWNNISHGALYSTEQYKKA
jgi:hypothetical protein